MDPQPYKPPSQYLLATDRYRGNRLSTSNSIKLTSDKEATEHYAARVMLINDEKNCSLLGLNKIELQVPPVQGRILCGRTTSPPKEQFSEAATAIHLPLFELLMH